MTKPKSAEKFEELTKDWGFDFDGYFSEDGRWVYTDYVTGIQYGTFLLGWNAGYVEGYDIGRVDGYYGGDSDIKRDAGKNN